MKKIIALLLAMLLLWGCGEGAKELKDVNMADLYTKLEGLPEMLELDATMQLNLYGIRQEDVKESVVSVSSDGLLADEIWLIKAVDGEAAERIRTLADNRIKQKDAESITYSPEQNKVVKAAWVAVEGSYVFLICSPNASQMRKTVESAIGK